MVSVWESKGTIAAVDRMLLACAAMPRIAEKRSDIHVIAQGAQLPEAEVRDHFIEAMRRHESALACVAVVVEGTGFGASAMRSFVTGLHWLAPRSFHFGLHSSVAEVAARLPAVHERLSGVHLEPLRFRHLLDEWVTLRHQPHG
jgi:hypothetical protein